MFISFWAVTVMAPSITLSHHFRQEDALSHGQHLLQFVLCQALRFLGCLGGGLPRTARLVFWMSAQLDSTEASYLQGIKPACCKTSHVDAEY